MAATHLVHRRRFAVKTYLAEDYLCTVVPKLETEGAHFRSEGDLEGSTGHLIWTLYFVTTHSHGNRLQAKTLSLLDLKNEVYLRLQRYPEAIQMENAMVGDQLWYRVKIRRYNVLRACKASSRDYNHQNDIPLTDAQR